MEYILRHFTGRTTVPLGHQDPSGTIATVIFNDAPEDLYSTQRSQCIVHSPREQHVCSGLILPDNCTWESSDLEITSPDGSIGRFEMTVDKHASQALQCAVCLPQGFTALMNGAVLTRLEYFSSLAVMLAPTDCSFWRTFWLLQCRKDVPIVYDDYDTYNDGPVTRDGTGYEFGSELEHSLTEGDDIAQDDNISEVGDTGGTMRELNVSAAQSCTPIDMTVVLTTTKC